MSELTYVGDPQHMTGVDRAHAVEARRSRRSARALQLWAKLTLTGVIALLIGTLLGIEADLGPVRLVGLTVAITGIWVLALRTIASSMRARGLDSMVAVLIGAALGFGLIAFADFVVFENLVTPRRLVIMAAGVFVLAGAFQAMSFNALSPRRRVILLGAEEDARQLARALNNGERGQFECIGVVADRNGGAGASAAPFLGESEDLVDVIDRERPDLLVSLTEDLRTQVVDQLLDAGVTTVRVVDSFEFHEHAFHRVASSGMPSSWFASVLDMERANYPARAKRAFDITAASLALLVFSPLLLLIPVAIRLGGGGPALYRQTRSGEGGRPFQMLKFRTMVRDAEDGKAVWAAEGDPRITPVGRVLRRTRMDELPQLWNVLRGEMSIVGPRPERPEYFEMLRKELPFWNRRLLLKPGITGWAQLHLGYTADVSGAATKLSYDLYYLKHRSLALDFLILLGTLELLFSGRGAR